MRMSLTSGAVKTIYWAFVFHINELVLFFYAVIVGFPALVYDTVVLLHYTETQANCFR